MGEVDGFGGVEEGVAGSVQISESAMINGMTNDNVTHLLRIVPSLQNWTAFLATSRAVSNTSSPAIAIDITNRSCLQHTK